MPKLFGPRLNTASGPPPNVMIFIIDFSQGLALQFSSFVLTKHPPLNPFWLSPGRLPPFFLPPALPWSPPFPSKPFPRNFACSQVLPTPLAPCPWLSLLRLNPAPRCPNAKATFALLRKKPAQSWFRMLALFSARLSFMTHQAIMLSSFVISRLIRSRSKTSGSLTPLMTQLSVQPRTPWVSLHGAPTPLLHPLI